MLLNNKIIKKRICIKQINSWLSINPFQVVVLIFKSNAYS